MDTKKYKILYVEDEEAIRKIVETLLEEKAQKIFLAKDAIEGLSIYEKEKPQIIITDLNMPKMSGIDFVSTIRKKDQSTRVIMLTARSDIETLQESAALKLTKYLIKPIDYKELFEAIDLAIKEMNTYRIIDIKRLELQDNYSWDFSERNLLKDGKEVSLTPKEKDILYLFFSNLNSTITYEHLGNTIWEDCELYNTDTIKTTIKNLRRKLPKDIIKNIYGIGFKVEL